jgi:prepilin-type N-terminal cleavage/methylation domain-containing protein
LRAEVGTRSPTGAGTAAARPLNAPRWRRAFSLIEVMIAIAFIGIAMLALLSLHQRNLAGVIDAQDLTRASMLAQELMSSAEVERFPMPGQRHGDFSRDFPGQFKNFRWKREVTLMPQFPDMRRIHVSVFYGRKFSRRFDLLEFVHNPQPPPVSHRTGVNPGAEDSEPNPAQ